MSKLYKTFLHNTQTFKRVYTLKQKGEDINNLLKLYNLVYFSGLLQNTRTEIALYLLILHFQRPYSAKTRKVMYAKSEIILAFHFTK